MSTRAPRLGPCIYRAMDGKSDYAAIVTLIEPEGDRVSLTVFQPSAGMTFYTRIKFSVENTRETAVPGTAYWDAPIEAAR